MTKLIPFRDNLWLTELQVDADFLVRGAVIIGRSGVVVWDTLTRPALMQPVLPLLPDRPLTVVYSHADWDHIWGTAALPLAPIVAHRLCRERFATDVPITLREYQAARPGVYDEVVLLPPTEVFESSLTLDLGDISVELHHLPGHTPDCIVAFIPQWGILLAGDTVETPLPVVNADSPLDIWIAGLERWAQDERVEQVILCHGALGDRSLIHNTIAYLGGLPSGSCVVPGDLDEFYRQTHADNLRHAK